MNMNKTPKAPYEQADVSLIHPVHKTVFDAGYIVDRHPYLRHLWRVRLWSGGEYYYDREWIRVNRR